MEQFRFRKWKVYQDSQTLFSDIVPVVKALPYEFKSSLGDQVTRSSLSVVLSMAEGSGKSSIKELNKFLDISLGSLYETLACVDTLRKNNLITQEQLRKFEDIIQNICSQLGGFKKKLKASYTKTT